MQAARLTKSRVAAIVLCGGHSTRMGQPKAMLQLGGETLLERIVRINRQAVARVCVVAASNQALPKLPDDVEIVRDSVPDRGPLQGILDGMNHLCDRFDAAFVCGCDMPLLASEVIRFLVVQLGDHEIVMPEVDGRDQPLAAVYRLSLVDRVRELLAQGSAGPSALAKQCRTRRIRSDELKGVDPNLMALCSVDTPEQWKAIGDSFRQY